MHNRCENLREYLEEQIKALQQDPDFLKDKWYRSEEAGKDIGISTTLNHFTTIPEGRHFLETYREKYCSGICSDRQNCEISSRYMDQSKKAA